MKILGNFFAGVILALCILSAAAPSPAGAQATRLQAPSGFRQVWVAPGWELYRKDYSNGTPDFVQVIDLRQGAGVELLPAPVVNPGEGKGVYGGDNPQFQYQSLQRFWKEFSASNPDAQCVANGLFFYMPDNPTRLAFPLKKDGQVLTDGYGIREYPNAKLMLEIWPDQVNISPLSAYSLYHSSAPNILGGLSEEANKRAKKAVGRTMLGIADQDGDGQFETILVLNTQTAVQENAFEVLKSFGAVKTMMLDGGGSAQLICRGTPLVPSDRLIPQAIGIAAGSPSTPAPSGEPNQAQVQALAEPPAPAASPSPALVLAQASLATPRPPSAASQVGDLVGRPGINAGDVFLIPLVILPVAGLLFGIIFRLRRPTY